MHTFTTTLTNATTTGHFTQQPDINDTTTVDKSLVTFAKEKLGMVLQPYNITAIHDLPPRRDGTRADIMQLLSAEKKATLMSLQGSLRGTSIYLNDHLSPFNTELFRQARQLKRDVKIHMAWTMNCCVLIRRREVDIKIQIRQKCDLVRLLP